MIKKILDDPVNGRLSKDELDKALDNMTEEVWLENWEPFIEKYINMFGNLPPMNNFHCSRSKYTHALLKSLEEKKEISEYLKEI